MANMGDTVTEVCSPKYLLIYVHGENNVSLKQFRMVSFPPNFASVIKWLVYVQKEKHVDWKH